MDDTLLNAYSFTLAKDVRLIKKHKHEPAGPMDVYQLLVFLLNVFSIKGERIITEDIEMMWAHLSIELHKELSSKNNLCDVMHASAVSESSLV